MHIGGAWQNDAPWTIVDRKTIWTTVGEPRVTAGVGQTLKTFGWNQAPQKILKKLLFIYEIIIIYGSYDSVVLFILMLPTYFSCHRKSIDWLCVHCCALDLLPLILFQLLLRLSFTLFVAGVATLKIFHPLSRWACQDFIPAGVCFQQAASKGRCLHQRVQVRRSDGRSIQTVCCSCIPQSPMQALPWFGLRQKPSDCIVPRWHAAKSKWNARKSNHDRFRVPLSKLKREVFLAKAPNQIPPFTVQVFCKSDDFASAVRPAFQFCDN